MNNKKKAVKHLEKINEDEVKIETINSWSAILRM